MWDLIVSVPDHCLSFYFEMRIPVCLPRDSVLTLGYMWRYHERYKHTVLTLLYYEIPLG